MNLCGVQVGLQHPFFLIAGARRRVEQGPRGTRGCDRGDAPLGNEPVARDTGVVS